MTHEFIETVLSATPVSGRLTAAAVLKSVAAPGALAGAAALSGARRGSILGVRARNPGVLRFVRNLLLEAFYDAGMRVGLVSEPPSFCRYCDAKTNVKLSERMAAPGGGGIRGSRGDGIDGFGRLKKAYPSKLSALAQKKLALACASSINPDVCVIERVTAGLDKSESAEALALIRRVVKGPAVVVSEDFFELEYLCSWVLAVDDGMGAACLIDCAGALARSPSLAAYAKSLNALAASPGL